MSTQQPVEGASGVEAAQQQPPKAPRNNQNNSGPRTSNPKNPRNSNQKAYTGSQTSHTGTNNHRYNKNGGHYKGNRSNSNNNSGLHGDNGMNNVQWGYQSYNMAAQPQYYPSYGYGYMPAMAAQGYAPGSPVGPAGSLSPADGASVTPLASSSTPPVSKKIEITNRSGEHVDLNAIHSQHISSGAPPMAAPESPKKEVVKAAEPIASEQSPAAEPVPPVETPKEASADEQLKMSFLEQVRLRKAMRAQKKTEESAPVPSQPAQGSPEAASEPTPSEVPAESTEKEEVVSEVAPETQTEVVTQPAQTEEETKPEPVEQAQKLPAETAKPLTFAEKLRLKNKIPQKSESTTTDEPKSAAAEEISKVEEPSKTEEAAKAVENVKGDGEESKAEVEEPKVEVEEPKAEDNEESIAADVNVSEDAEQDNAEAKGETSVDEEAKNAEAQGDADVDDGRMTMTELLQRLQAIDAVEDAYSFEYPEGVEAPDARHKKETIKYTYGPAFLLQFQDKVNIRPDAEWKQNVASKIVIPPGTVRQVGRPRGDSKFGPGANFKKSGSMRGMEGRSNSRNNSKRKSKRMGDDRKSNRAYTSRKDREKMAEEEAQRVEEEVAPLVPSANRWVPKSKQKKAEKKLAPDGVTELIEKDEAERKMKSLLNKLTLEKFDPISEEIIKIADQSKWETDCLTLKVVIEEIFRKACDEPHWSSMYAQLCGKVVKDMDTEIQEEGVDGKTGPKLVLHYLVDRCHAEFQKGWTDKLPTKEDGSPLEPEMMSDEYYQMAAAKRRGLGLVRLIGFLYRSHLLTAKMMFECFRRLMKDLSDSPSEETLESVLELLSTVGEQFEGDRMTQQNGVLEGATVLDQLFYMLDKIVEADEISSRIKFKLKDMIELREVKNWNSIKRDEGPKTIQQIHDEEAAKKAMEERERRYKGNSRSSSRRTNSNIMMGTRSNSRREPAPVSKDSFISTRSSSLRHVQSAAKEDAPQQKTSVNMFDALMGAESDDDE
ncbi:uncharacterized protein LALA0_S08e06502g [Lachancea lanzarotensis]|uniref:LALA0S08e06502g1_1 n=1 Tax=Lachancea lanzarotensis TaxID=1245769 RepID=A0A0C7NB18_9SACH|nr:uncharacterized protein LALA0_S08e06502g [Lachancea lanzarotensis]CEP63609.1 LALA0S08e06502g1_1 [Lachancea lanzarotensis]